MYKEEELDQITLQEKRRWLALVIPAVPLLALVIWGAAARIEPLAVGASFAFGVLLIAGWGLFIRPVHVYRRYVDAMLNGRNHLVTGAFIGFDPDESMVDDVLCRGLRLTCMDDKDKPYERLFYLDAEKPQPDLRAGQRITVRFHDRQIVDIQPADQA